MNKKTVGVLYALNIIFGAFYTLAFPVGVAVLAAHLLTKYVGAPSFIWAILITVGVIGGFIAMVKFVISSMSALEKAEKAREELQARETQKLEKQRELREFAKNAAEASDKDETEG